MVGELNEFALAAIVDEVVLYDRQLTDEEIARHSKASADSVFIRYSDHFDLPFDNVAPEVLLPAEVPGVEGVEVVVNPQITDPGDEEFTYDWQLSLDGQPVHSSFEPIFRFTPQQRGNYDLTLVVHDGDDEGQATSKLEVTNGPPIVSVAANRVDFDEMVIDPETVEPNTVTFTGSFRDPTPGAPTSQTFAWDFGDGSDLVTDTLNPTHQFPNSGEYTVTLRVTDNEGAVGVGTQLITIKNLAPISFVELPLEFKQGELWEVPGSFTDFVGDDLTGSINFGDGVPVPLELTRRVIDAGQEVFFVNHIINNEHYFNRAG